MSDTPSIQTIDSPFVHAASQENFAALVLDNSSKGPVLVNFWSRKAGPCLRQYPVLDKVIHGYKGRVLLVNIDIDHEFVIPKEYGITSVPTLKLFRDREVVETRHGYQSENDLQAMLDNYIERDSDALLAQAIQHYAQKNPTLAYQVLTDAIVDDPENPRLPLAMGKMLKYEQRYDDALKLLLALPADLQKNTEIMLYRNLLSFYLEIDPQDGIEVLMSRITDNPDDLSARQQLAAHFTIDLQYEQALQQLVEIMDIDQSYQDDFAQSAMLKLFTIVGSTSPLIAKYRNHLRRYRH